MEIKSLVKSMQGLNMPLIFKTLYNEKVDDQKMCFLKEWGVTEHHNAMVFDAETVELPDGKEETKVFSTYIKLDTTLCIIISKGAEELIKAIITKILS